MAWTHRILIPVPMDRMEAMADGLEDLFIATSLVEVEEDRLWRVEGLTSGPPVRGPILARVALLAAVLGIAEPEVVIEPVPQTDWLDHVHKALPVLEVGPFFIHGSHHAERRRAGRVALWVDAATAFGSGTHSSTQACLEELGRLKRRLRRRPRVLDMGCGSGILALGAARLWRRPVVAIDTDPEAVAVTRLNARRNGVAGLVRAETGPGYRTSLCRRRRPFDLVLANILARPLARMAPQLRRHLARGGTAVLAGLMTRQEPLVLAAQRAAGLRLVARRRTEGGWSALVMRRGRWR